MTIQHPESKHKKHLTALLTAFGMTLLMGFLILAVGVNALFFNKSSAEAAAPPTAQQDSSYQAAIQQLQDQVAQYQTREAQYQTELQQAADNLNQTNQQLQEYKQLTQELVNAGIIQITSDGQVSVGSAFRPGFRTDDDD